MTMKQGGIIRPPPRLEHTTVCLPIVYGSVAFYLGKKAADEYQTHQWTLYVRGPHGDEDLSPVIEKVIFQLHASFAQPIREITEPPFEVTERGWGEFDAQIRILWKDPLEQAIVVTHPIKLYPPVGNTPISHVVPPETSSAPVVSESYDEVVFTDPTEAFFASLQRLVVAHNKKKPELAPAIQYSQAEHFGKTISFSDFDQSTALIEAQKYLESQLVSTKTRLLTVEAELQQVDAALREQVRLNKLAMIAAQQAQQQQQQAQHQQQHHHHHHQHQHQQHQQHPRTTTSTTALGTSSVRAAAGHASSAQKSSSGTLTKQSMPQSSPTKKFKVGGL